MAEEQGESRYLPPIDGIIIPDNATTQEAMKIHRMASEHGKTGSYDVGTGHNITLPARPIGQQEFYSQSASRFIQNASSAMAASENAVRSGFRREAGTGPVAQRAREKAYWDPTRSPTLWMIPFNIQTDPEQYKRLYQWTQFFYATHYLFPTLVDIYARFPLVGFEHQCKDPYIQKFFDHLFLEELDYLQFLLDLNTEFWKVGEVLPMADWSDDLGCWVADELMSPIHVRVEVYPILGQRRFIFEPPSYLQEIATKGRPYVEFQVLTQSLNDDILKAIQAGHGFELSADRVTQLKRGPRWAPRGEPLLMRILRHMMIEEKLFRAYHAITERMITPLILAKLGDASITMPDGFPYMPMQEDIDHLQRTLEEAMDSDYKVLSTHFAVNIEAVLGFEVMPKLGEEFAAIEEKMCMIFGIPLDLLKGGGSAPFASTALSADILSQNLAHNQEMLKQFLYKKRYEPVARAHEFYDYNLKGGRREIIYERIQTLDEEGELVIREVPKLLIPDVHLASMNLRDEATQRQFLTELRQMGVPISDGAMMVGIDYSLDDETDKIKTELIERELAKAETIREMEKAFKEHGIPIDKEYIAKVVATKFGGEVPESMFGDMEQPEGDIGGGPPPDMMNDEEMGGAPRIKNRPDISDEMRDKATPEQIAAPEAPETAPGGGAGAAPAPAGGGGGGAPAGGGAGVAGAAIYVDKEGNEVVRKTFDETRKADRADDNLKSLTVINTIAKSAQLTDEDMELVKEKLAELEESRKKREAEKNGETGEDNESDDEGDAPLE